MVEVSEHMSYPRREREVPYCDADEAADAGRMPTGSAGADMGSAPKEWAAPAPRPVEVRIVHAQPPAARPSPPPAPTGGGARWFWRIVAVAALVALVGIGLEILAGLHQLAAGQAAQTAAIGRQTGVLAGIERDLAGIRIALDNVAATLGRAVAALRRIGG